MDRFLVELEKELGKSPKVNTDGKWWFMLTYLMGKNSVLKVL